MAEKLGTLIKNARTGAGLTQDQLAKKVNGLTASDISKAERGEAALTQAQLKEIAKATGVTQSSLLNAAKGTAASSAKKPAASSAKKPASSSAKKPASSSGSGKTGSSAASSLKLTEAEAKLVRLYRKADAKTKKAAMEVLLEEKTEIGSLLETLLSSAGSAAGSGASAASGSDSLASLLQSAMGMLGKKQSDDPGR